MKSVEKDFSIQDGVKNKTACSINIIRHFLRIVFILIMAVNFFGSAWIFLFEKSNKIVVLIIGIPLVLYETGIYNSIMYFLSTPDKKSKMKNILNTISLILAFFVAVMIFGVLGNYIEDIIAIIGPGICIGVLVFYFGFRVFYWLYRLYDSY